ncbi:MAG TPA: carboxymuconolactone decarboxylase family protein [Solirubrobacterales bacterium]
MPTATKVLGDRLSPLDRRPRTFASPGEALRELAGAVSRTPVLASAYLQGGLEPELRERVMVAVSRVNACRGCTRVHERWAIRTGVTSKELEAIGQGDLAALDDRNRAAIVYATALAEARFRGPVGADLVADVAESLTASEMTAVEAVARVMCLANLSANTAESLVERLRAEVVGAD